MVQCGDMLCTPQRNGAVRSWLCMLSDFKPFLWEQQSHYTSLTADIPTQTLKFGCGFGYRGTFSFNIHVQTNWWKLVPWRWNWKKKTCLQAFRSFITSIRNAFKFYFLKSTKHLQAAPSPLSQADWWTSPCLEGRRAVWPVFSIHRLSELETPEGVAVPIMRENVMNKNAWENEQKCFKFIQIKHWRSRGFFKFEVHFSSKKDFSKQSLLWSPLFKFFFFLYAYLVDWLNGTKYLWSLFVCRQLLQRRYEMRPLEHASIHSCRLIPWKCVCVTFHKFQK